MSYEFLQYETTEQAISGTHCFYDCLMDSFDINLVLGRGTIEEVIMFLKEYLPNNIRRYQHARARAVELSGKDLEELRRFPEDIVGDLRNLISNALSEEHEWSKVPRLVKILNGADGILSAMSNSEG